jgi:hypothetical protein
MTRSLLQWSDLRPTLLRAVGRSDVEYQIEQSGVGRWVLYRFAAAGGADGIGARVSEGWLADMKALAEEAERDALGPAPEPQRIEWRKKGSGHHCGAARSGRAYRILKIGDTCQLERLGTEHAKTGTVIDEGSLQAMKASAQRDAADADAMLSARSGGGQP